MKRILLLACISSSILAAPLDQMNERLKAYSEVTQVMCDPSSELSDEGLFVDVSCQFKCLNRPVQIEQVRGPFIPRQQGLYPGNGSNDKNIIWSALGISLKMWSQNICFEKAAAGCQGAQLIEEANIKGLTSGAWKMERFPGCSEKTVTLSPFTNAAGSSRILHQVTELTPKFGDLSVDAKKSFQLEVAGLNLNLALAKFNLPAGEKNFATGECKKIIKAKLCFGDCVDLNSSGQDMTETLATPEPLGTEEIEMCADELLRRLSKEKLSAGVRAQLCEAYFWQSFLKLDYRLFKSCAAIRGETNCQEF